MSTPSYSGLVPESGVLPPRQVRSGNERSILVNNVWAVESRVVFQYPGTYGSIPRTQIGCFRVDIGSDLFGFERSSRRFRDTMVDPGSIRKSEYGRKKDRDRETRSIRPDGYEALMSTGSRHDRKSNLTGRGRDK